MCASAYGAVILCGIALSMISPQCFADSISIFPSKDNTLIQSNTGSRSNGSGFTFFSGRVGSTAGGTIRRAVLAFDLSGLPAGSVITSVKLTLSMNAANTGPQAHTLHRLLANWGEGASAGDTGLGAPSQSNDATWIHRFYPGSPWGAPGGDFVTAASATQIVGIREVAYSWQSSGMVADVQGWLDAPATNFGWLLKGNESVIQTVKRFASREVEDPFSRPRLEIEYTPLPSCVSDLTHDDITGVPDLLAVINSWGECPLPCLPYCYCDIAPDCRVDTLDLLAVINNWGLCD